MAHSLCFRELDCKQMSSKAISHKNTEFHNKNSCLFEMVCHVAMWIIFMRGSTVINIDKNK